MTKMPLKRSPLGGALFKFVQRFESAAVEANTPDSRRIQMDLLSALANSSELQMCGGYPFQHMKIFHDGVKWIMELEATGLE